MWYVICPDTLASPCLPLTTMNNCEAAAINFDSNEIVKIAKKEKKQNNYSEAKESTGRPTA